MAIVTVEYDNSSMRSLNRNSEREAQAREAHYSSFLDPFKATWKGRSFLDVGAGTGWLVAEALQYGAQRAVGIEPSGVNLQAARDRFPGIDMVGVTLEEYQTQHRFSHITAVMSICHIVNLEEAFRKLLVLSYPEANIYAVVPDPNHFLQNRYGDQEVAAEEVDTGVWVTRTETPTGCRTEIIRDLDLYTLVAIREGFTLVAEKPMPPTETLIQTAPRYASIKNPMTHLLVYKAS